MGVTLVNLDNVVPDDIEFTLTVKGEEYKLMYPGDTSLESMIEQSKIQKKVQDDPTNLQAAEDGIKYLYDTFAEYNEKIMPYEDFKKKIKVTQYLKIQQTINEALTGDVEKKT